MEEELYTPTQPDAIDDLVAALNAATGGALTFERDVLDVDRPEDWGAVELTGTSDEWADGQIIDQCLRLDIWAAVGSRSVTWKRVIETVLRGYGDRLVYRFRERGYLHDLHKVLWRWEAWIWMEEA